MNAPAPPAAGHGVGSYNWQAIGIAVAVAFAIGYVGTRLPGLANFEEHPERVGITILAMNALSLFGATVCGAIAGWLGAPRSVLHGAIAGVLDIVLGFTYGVVASLLAERGAFDYMMTWAYWLAVVPLWVGGLLLCIGAAWLAGVVRKARV